MVKKPKSPSQGSKKNVSFSEAMTTWIGTPQSLIVHTIFFIAAFVLIFLGIDTDEVLLFLTTVVSLEAIYLAIFIQMTVNRNTESLKEVEADIDEIQEDVDELQEDVEDISEEIDEDDVVDEKTRKSLNKIEGQLQILVKEIEMMKRNKRI